MRRRPVVAVLAMVGLAVIGLLGGLAPSSFAASGEVDAVGWWTRNPGQSAPAGGIAVAVAPDGPVTVSAVAIDLGTGALTARLIAVETGGVGASGATVQVCRSTDGWTPAEGGALADAPEHSCDQTAVPFERDADAARWSADITSLVGGAEGVVSLAIVPGAGDPLAAFDVRFASPVAEVTPIPAPAEVPAAPDGSGFGSGTSDTGGQPASSGSIDFTPAPSAAPSSPSFEPTPVVDSGSESILEDAEASADDVDLPEPTGDELAVPILPTSSDGSPNHRTVGKALTYVLLSAMAGIAVGGGSRVVRARAVR